MRSIETLVPILGLGSTLAFWGALTFWHWYERHQLRWRLQLQASTQAATATAVQAVLNTPKPPKPIKPTRPLHIPKPAAPCNCAECRQQQIGQALGIDREMYLLPKWLWPYVRNDAVIPYAATKSRRGAPKRISTHGFACPHLDCRYRGVTDATLHALIGYGGHGRHERIPDFFCQACRRKITSRTMTALYYAHKPSDEIVEAVAAILEGMSEEGASRALNSKPDSDNIRRWIAKAAHHSTALQAILLRDLSLSSIQLDELRAKIRAPSTLQHLGQSSKFNTDESIVWVWTAICPTTKIIPVVEVGPRTQAMANTVLHKLKLQTRANCSPLFLTDGLLHYYFAITNHWGSWINNQSDADAPTWQVDPNILYAQLRKHKVRRKLLHTETVALVGYLNQIQARLRHLGFSRKIQTAYIERLNATARADLAALARRTLALARSSDHLHQLLVSWQGYQNFCRPHRSLKLSRKQQPDPSRRDRTPTMAAGISDSVWSLKHFLLTPTFPSLAQSVNGLRLSC